MYDVTDVTGNNVLGIIPFGTYQSSNLQTPYFPGENMLYELAHTLTMITDDLANMSFPENITHARLSVGL